MTGREQRLSALIESIYDAGLGRNDWTGVISDICALLGRGQGCLEYMDYSTLEGRALGVHGYAEDVGLDELYPLMIEHDPWAHRIPWDYASNYAIGAVILSEQERQATFFVNELSPLVGLETKDILGTFLSRSCGRTGAKASVGALMIYAGDKQERFDKADVMVMERLRPHLVKALELQARLEIAETTSICQQQALDNLPSAFFLLDGLGRVLFANAKAAQMLSGPALHTQKLELHFTDNEADAALQSAVAAARTSHYRANDADCGAFLAHPPQIERPLSVLVAPAAPATTLSLLTDLPERLCIAVSISDHDPIVRAKILTMQKLHGLTDAETRVLGHFADSKSTQQIADATGNSVLTIRTQLKSIMEKLGVHSQRELIAFVYTGLP